MDLLRYLALGDSYTIGEGPITRRSGIEAVMLADDGLHPSGAMYTVCAQTMLGMARRALRQNDE